MGANHCNGRRDGRALTIAMVGPRREWAPFDDSDAPRSSIELLAGAHDVVEWISARPSAARAAAVS
ncbi:Hypothetical protein A7982_09037 [Minicystis rosea]|nr:Hypothetical protein A7982_09037 [Minicystis rosea]